MNWDLGHVRGLLIQMVGLVDVFKPISVDSKDWLWIVSGHLLLIDRLFLVAEYYLSRDHIQSERAVFTPLFGISSTLLPWVLLEQFNGWFAFQIDRILFG